MADDVKIEHNTDPQGRRVETRVYETVVDGKKERVVETHVEQIPMVLSERVVEEIAPVVTTRKKETYKDGKVVDSHVEELDKGTMKMVPAAKPQESLLTKDDLMNAIREVVNAREQAPREVKPVAKTVAPVVVAPEPEKEEAPVVVQPKKASPVVAAGSKIWELVEVGAYVVLSGELAFCLYQLVLKNWL